MNRHAKARASESASQRSARSVQKRAYLKRTRSEQTAKRQRSTYAQNPSQTVEERGMKNRLNRRMETQRRNQRNQAKVLLLKAEAKKRKSRARLKRYATQQQRDQAQFCEDIDAPIAFICGSCGELGNARSMQIRTYNRGDPVFQTLEVTETAFSYGLIHEAIVENENGKTVPFCESCLSHLKRRQKPMFCIANGFLLCDVPLELAVLNTIELRMVGLGICFTTCYNLQGDGQECSRGNAINFWNDTFRIASSLPHPLERCGVIQMRYKGRSTQCL